MSATSSAPGGQEKRFAAYLDRLAQAAEHADRVEPLKSYCTGLLLPGERKSVEPMAARLAPDNVRQTHQSLHHLVAHAPWSDEAVLQQVRQSVLPQMEQKGPVIAWIVYDTDFLKKGTHSVGVARQYCGQIGKPRLPARAPNVINPIRSQRYGFSSPGIFSSDSLAAPFAVHDAANNL